MGKSLPPLDRPVFVTKTLSRRLGEIDVCTTNAGFKTPLTNPQGLTNLAPPLLRAPSPTRMRLLPGPFS